jgi:hypothetical protein
VTDTQTENALLEAKAFQARLAADLVGAAHASAARLEERAAIIAYLRDETQIMAATVQAQNTLLEAAAKIEAGRHLK